MAALANDPAFDVGDYTEYSSKVQAACPWYPPTDISGFPYESPLAAAASPESLMLGMNVMLQKEEAMKACPVNFVTKDAPPFMILHGMEDHTVPFGQGEILHDRLEEAGCDVKLIAIEGGGGSRGQAVLPEGDLAAHCRVLPREIRIRKIPGIRGRVCSYWVQMIWRS